VGFERFTWRAARAPSVASLASAFFDDARELMRVPVVALYAFGDEGIEVHGCNLPVEAVEAYERHGRAHDPVLASVARSHVPCATSLVELRAHAVENRLPDGFVELIEASPGRHCIQAPLVADGVLVGTLNFARTEDRRFGPCELAVASALSLHVSTRLAALRALDDGVDASLEELLTPRGLEVAELAARGLTMEEVGRVLGVSANTAKKHLRVVYERLGVGSRAELAGALLSPRPSRAASPAR
jgi:DNA-binding CsgD family transcriptional regulator